MKIPFRDIESFAKTPSPKARVILVYGPDHGLMRERAASMGKSVVSDLNDPFNVAALSTAILLEDPARLSDEASALSMMGGERLIRIEDASDKLTPLMKEYLAAPSDNALIIMEAGPLGPKSSLRKLMEKIDNGAALPCYVEDARDLSRLIRDTIAAENLTIQPDAVAWLAINISGNRQKVRAELEKLVIYKGDETSPITIEDAQAACGETGARSLDDLVYATAGRRSADALRTYDHLMEEGIAFMAVLRALQNHFRKLHVTKCRLAEGENEQIAMKKLIPQIFFKQEQAFKAQLNNWSMPALSNTLARLASIEAECKKTASPIETLCAQAILGISKSR